MDYKVPTISDNFPPVVLADPPRPLSSAYSLLSFLHIGGGRTHVSKICPVTGAIVLLCNLLNI